MTKAKTYFPLLCGPEFLPQNVFQRHREVSGLEHLYDLCKERSWKWLEEFDAYLAKTDIAIIVTDIQEKIEWINMGFTNMTGFNLEEVQGHKPAKILQGEGTSTKTRQRLRKHINDQESFSDQILNYRKNGEPYWCKLDVWPLYDNENELVNFIAFEKEMWEVPIKSRRMA